MKHHPKLKRGGALALSVLCLASVCMGIALAAGNSGGTEEIRLQYDNNKVWDYVAKDGLKEDTTNTAYMLTGSKVTVQMSLSDNQLPQIDEDKQPLLVDPKTAGATSVLNIGITGTGRAGEFDISADLEEDKKLTRPEQFNITANVNSITPVEGYKGTVRATTTTTTSNGNVSGSAMAGARLLNAMAFADNNQLTIRVIRGETAQSTLPFFEIVETGCTGAFDDYKTGRIAVETENSDLGKLSMANKRITFSLTKEDGTGEVRIEFTQPLSYSDIAAPDLENDRIVYVDKDGAPCPDQDVDKRFRIENNFLRVGTTYTLSFSPRSEILSLQVATPEYVASEIARNIGSDTRGAFLKMADGDRLEMITEDITLTTYDWRYNAQFDIVWEWTPDLPEEDEDGNPPEDFAIPDEFRGEKNPWKAYKDAAYAVVPVPPPGQGTDKTPTSTAHLELMEDNISGVLTAKVYYKAKTEDYEKGEPLASHSFNIVVRGKGVTASVTPNDQKYGMPEGAISVPNDKYNDVKKFPALPDSLPPKLYMDVFRGGITEFEKPGTGPCDYELQLNMGQKNARSLYAVVTLEEVDDPNLTSNLDAVTLFTTSDKNVLEQYTPGMQIANPKAGPSYTDEGTKPLLIRAVAPGAVTLKVEYYASVNGQPRLDSTYSTTIVVTDSSPSKDSTLSGLTLRDAGRKEPEIDFGFDPAQSSYENPVIELPYEFESYNFVPIVNETVASEKPIEVRAWDSAGREAALFENGEKSDTTVKSGENLQITLREDPEKDKTKVGKVYWISLTVLAADPREKTEYILCVTRLNPSEVDTLKSIGVYAQEDTDGETNLVTGFDPEKKAYLVTVPYNTDYLRVNAVQSFSRALVSYDPELTKLSFFGAAEYLDLEKCYPAVNINDPELDVTKVYEGIPLPYFEIHVTSEKEKYKKDLGKATGIYRVFVNRLPPSEESRMRELTIVDAADTAATPVALPYTPTYSMDNTGPYRLTDENAVSYSTSAVRFKVTPEDELVSAIRIYDKDKSRLLTTIENPNVFSEPVSVAARNADQLYNDFVIEIVSEAGDGKTGASLAASGNKDYYTDYYVQIERNEPNTDAELLDVELNDQDGKPLKMFSFHRDETRYEITLPYAVRSVSFTAKTNDANAAIQLKDHENLIHSTGLSLDPVTSGSSTKLYKLNDPGSPRTFDLIVTAEDGKTEKTYTFIIDREPPSNDALLKKLTVEGLTEDGITPVFKPHDTAYSGTVEEGAEGIRVTPTANDENATIMVDGLQVESGRVSELIELLEVETKLEIVVTAEDGVTKMTYVLDLYNQNLVDKSNNADLSMLRVERGVMTPTFRAAVTEYEVAVKEDTWSVDIIPMSDDPLAEVQVLNGTRELGDYNGNYGLALSDGENQVTVRVTSPDKTQVKDYSITIYRNQEDALKTLTPLTADDMDLENTDNPIIISISEYPRIDSSVFSALKEYPEKTIIFQGLDYSLTFQAANLNTVIPTREIYDFRLSFESPDAEAIKAHMGQWEANAGLMDDLVMIYFDYHGDLPGPATLNLKLGNKYGGQTLFWHYYNRERGVIEFYGTLLSNAQGSISVPINHFSTYLLTRNSAIAGAENYSSMLSQISATTGGKQNPTTGADGASDDGPGDGA